MSILVGVAILIQMRKKIVLNILPLQSVIFSLTLNDPHRVSSMIRGEDMVPGNCRSLPIKYTNNQTIAKF